mgnify:FL=1
MLKCQPLSEGVCMGTRRFKFSDSKPATGAWSARAADYSADVNKGPVVGQSEQSGKLTDIVNLFSERYEMLRKILRYEWGFKELSLIHI